MVKIRCFTVGEVTLSFRHLWRINAEVEIKDAIESVGHCSNAHSSMKPRCLQGDRIMRLEVNDL